MILCYMAEMDLLSKVEQFVIDAFMEAQNEVEILHYTRTVYWIRELKPDADEALLIAGMSHDIERAFYGDWKAGSGDEEKLKKHQELSAGIIGDFLKKQGVSEDFIQRVKGLVLRHESGGDGDQNVLCDADCLAWFEEKALRNAKKHKQEGREEEMKKKLDRVLERIHSVHAKEIVRAWYKAALHELDDSL